MHQTKSLDGRWLFTTDPEGKGESLGYPKGNKGGDFEVIEVPGYWRTKGVDFDGTGWYRREFNLPSELVNHYIYIYFQGVNYHCKVWVNGKYVGSHEGPFDPFSFDVTDHCRMDDSNLLVVKVSSSLDENPELKNRIRGATATWDCIPIHQGPPPDPLKEESEHYPYPVQAPGGIHGSVSLIGYRDLKLSELKVTPRLNKNDFPVPRRVELEIIAKIENLLEEAVKANLKLNIQPVNFEASKLEASYSIELHPQEEKVVNYKLYLNNPKLWWSWDLGEQNLYRLTLATKGQEAHHPKDKIQTVFGIRKFWREDKHFYLNGEKLFLKGCNYLSEIDPSQTSDEFYQRDIELMKEAHMNTIRCFANIEQPIFYKICDKEGMLIYQDLPFQWGYSTDKVFRTKALNYGKTLMGQLHNHPSIVLWCCHSEPRPWDWKQFNKELFDLVKEKVSNRVVIRASVFDPPPEQENLATSERTYRKFRQKYTTVPWKGWYEGNIYDIENIEPTFLSEFGAQALPQIESLTAILGEENLWPPNFKIWRYHDFQEKVHATHVGKASEFDNLETWVKESQKYQSELYKVQIESLRRRKYDPVAGVLQFLFVDCWPAVTWSILDYFRKPKNAYYSVKEAFKSVIITVTTKITDKGKDILQTSEEQQKEIEIFFHIVNDKRKKIEGARLKVRIDWAKRDSIRKEFSLDEIPADSSLKVAEVSISSKTFQEMTIQERLISSGNGIITENNHHLKPLKDENRYLVK